MRSGSRKSLPPSPGVYMITCTATGERYVGSSKNMQMRWATHRSRLKSGNGGNRVLQDSYNEQGVDGFTLEVLECVSDPTLLTEREAHYLQELRPECNIMPIYGVPLRVVAMKWPDDVLGQVDALAIARGVTRTSITMAALRRYLATEAPPTP